MILNKVYEINSSVIMAKFMGIDTDRYLDDDVFSGLKQLAFTFLKRGAVFGFISEDFIKILHPELKYVNEKGYDFVEISTGILIEQKAATANGITLSPSANNGIGRVQLEKNVFKEVLASKNYCIADHVYFHETGNFRYIFREGNFFKSEKVAYKKYINDIFNEELREISN